jgi:hypothetical protein
MKKRITIKLSLSAVAIVLSALLVAPAANASTVEECQALIASLRADTESVVLTGRQADKNRAGLLGKLDNASTSLSRVKLCDAIKKLNDFKVKINQLIASGSINTDSSAGVTGQDLLSGADQAIACIQDLVAQSGIVCE